MYDQKVHNVLKKLTDISLCVLEHNNDDFTAHHTHYKPS